jgi:alkanesulfonate monooxygenase SsuD/methylene tetrahydromethanopterin reductase-like flavin-dependent oxidoreductase (luciferase family)
MLAAQLGIRFSFAHFINAHFGHAVAQAYRERFQAGHEAKPYLAAAVFVICADTEREDSVDCAGCRARLWRA